MIAPLTKMTLAGVVWYQGESNYHSPELYACTYAQACRIHHANHVRSHGPELYACALCYFSMSDVAFMPGDDAC